MVLTYVYLHMAQCIGVVKALCCKPKVVGSRPDDVIEFLIYEILPAALGPGVYQASKRNEYQKQNDNVSGE
jgi:hypothetical protein